MSETEPRTAHDDYLVATALQLVDDHRKVCEGETCAISLMAIGELLDKAGIGVTEEEARRLW